MSKLRKSKDRIERQDRIRYVEKRNVESNKDMSDRAEYWRKRKIIGKEEEKIEERSKNFLESASTFLGEQAKSFGQETGI